MLPEALLLHIQAELNASVVSARPVTGGSINQAAKLELSSGMQCFLKWNTTQSPDMFAKEAKGLGLLTNADTDLIIPKVITQGIAGNATGYLLQEFIEEGQPGPYSAQQFGQELARLHKTENDRFGLDHDNYIGSLPQSNTPHTDWISFFIEERIEPQLDRAISAGKLSSSIEIAFKNMYRLLPDIFPEEPPGLLHGDLWGGNYFYDSEGRPVIYDPAVYYGHREMELAFTRLFGGFSSAFYRSYNESHPLEPGFDERKDIYNLYPLLVHTNLFGGSYAQQVEEIVKRFG